MPRFTFEGPDGKRHTIEGPEGSTPEEAFKHLQAALSPGLAKSAASGLIEGAGAPGDLSNSVLGNAPAQKPIDRDTYYGKLVDALNTARKYLELPTSQGIGNAVGMQPTQPVTLPEKAVQMTARALPGVAMGGSPQGRAMMGGAENILPSLGAARAALRPAPAAPPPQAAPNVSPNIKNFLPPGGPPQGGQGFMGGLRQGFQNAAGGDVGQVAQQAFLRAAAREGINTAGYTLGGPVGGAMARVGTKVLGLDQ